VTKAFRAKVGRLQDPPNAVQIELVEGCNLRCTFCGLSGIREPKAHNFKFIEEKTLVNTMRGIAEAGWNPRIEFAMHGEPTMHPEVVRMVRLTRELGPHLHIMMTSNGGGLLRKPGPAANVEALFSAGLNVLALDDYRGVGLVPKIREAWKARTTSEPLVQTYEYPQQDAGNPHRRVRYDQHILSFVEDITSATTGTHSSLNNHAGAGAPLNDSGAGKRCAKPFRELAVRWDGSVAVCCNDWRGTYKCGNVNDIGVDGVWQSSEMDAARQKLYYGQRDFGPCKGCDATSYRVGLLPDKYGKEVMPKPGVYTSRTIARALAGDPLTAPVLRPWEKQ
jgi:radical SAM protein with 4Fe4S-binding SPASM domain